MRSPMRKRRICAIGNSHMAAAKLGWEALADETPQYQIDFFGAPMGTIDDLNAEGHFLTPASDKLRQAFQWTSRGASRIDASAYDGFATFGLGVAGPTSAVSPLYTAFRLVQHAEPDVFLVSRACLTASMQGLLRSAYTLFLVHKVKSVSSAPLFCVAVPAPSPLIMSSPEHGRRPIASAGVLDLVTKLFDEHIPSVAAAEAFTYVPQPAETLDEGAFTRHEYIEQGVNFYNRVKKVNYGHANGAYGTVLMRRVLQALDRQFDG